MSTQYQSNFHECFPISDTALNALLIGSTALPWTVPGTPDIVYRATFSVGSNNDVWVRLNGTAQVPVSNTATVTPYQERIGIPYVRYVKGGDMLSFISTGATQVGVSLLQLPNRQ
jgi:hypothetical protein